MSEAGDNNSNDSECNATDGSNYSRGPSSISSSDIEIVNVRDMYIVVVSDNGDFEVILVNNTSNPVDSDDHTSAMCMSSDPSMNEFVMRKMEDRPPCYDDIGNDRIASPEIPDSYDEASTSYNFDEPPPEYDAVHYAWLDYSTFTEVTAMTTSEVVTRRANQVCDTRVQLIYSICEFPRRNHPTFTTVYQSPRMTTAVTGIGPANEEIAQRDLMHEVLSRIQRMRWMSMRREDPTTVDEIE